MLIVHKQYQIRDVTAPFWGLQCDRRWFLLARLLSWWSASLILKLHFREKTNFWWFEWRFLFRHPTWIRTHCWWIKTFICQSYNTIHSENIFAIFLLVSSNMEDNEFRVSQLGKVLQHFSCGLFERICLLIFVIDIILDVTRKRIPHIVPLPHVEISIRPLHIKVLFDFGNPSLLR